MKNGKKHDHGHEDKILRCAQDDTVKQLWEMRITADDEFSLIQRDRKWRTLRMNMVGLAMGAVNRPLQPPN